MHTPRLNFVIGLQCCADTVEVILEPQECTLTARVPTAANESGSGPIFCQQSEPQGSPVASLPSCAPEHSLPDLYQQQKLPCAHREILKSQEYTPIARASAIGVCALNAQTPTLSYRNRLESRKHDTTKGTSSENVRTK